MIRALDTDDDRRAAVPILQQLWTDASREEVLDWTDADEYHLFGRYVDGDLVGVAGVQVKDHLHHETVAWLYDLVVDADVRGEGHGTALVKHVESWARERDCQAVALASPVAKTAVHEYYDTLDYEKWGFVLEKHL